MKSQSGIVFGILAAAAAISGCGGKSSNNGGGTPGPDFQLASPDTLQGFWLGECIKQKEGFFPDTYQRRQYHFSGDRFIASVISFGDSAGCRGVANQGVMVATGKYTVTGDATDLTRGSNVDFLFETTEVAALSIEGANMLNHSAASCGFTSWQPGIARGVKGSCDAQAYYTTGLVPFDRLAVNDGKITLGSYVLYNNEGMTLEHRPDVYTQGEDLAKITDAQIQESTSAPQPATPGTKVLNLHDKSAPAAIPDGNGSIERTFTVEDSGSLTEIGLYVDISHRYGSDVRVSLRTPTGAVINLPTQSSSGAYSVRRWGAGGSPVTDLSNLWGTQVKGVWTVVFKDVSSSDSGTLNGVDFTLRFK